VPSLDEFAARIASTLEKYPYLVIEDCGVIVGYAYAGTFKDRAAYDRSCELSIYLDRGSQGKGYGRALYEELGLMMAWFDVIDYARESGLDASDSETVCRLLSEHDREALG
jgi:GNAT superfamily N-acetyltransferase